ncbi:hypothetical protein [Spiroplasma sp. Moj]|uniref:hypothetical protein n=1 Tax=Spiroplasma sp. Moj TaxID=1922342 RepID=UPI0039EF5889
MIITLTNNGSEAKDAELKIEFYGCMMQLIRVLNISSHFICKSLASINREKKRERERRAWSRPRTKVTYPFHCQERV